MSTNENTFAAADFDVAGSQSLPTATDVAEAQTSASETVTLPVSSRDAANIVAALLAVAEMGHEVGDHDTEHELRDLAKRFFNMLA